MLRHFAIVVVAAGLFAAGAAAQTVTLALESPQNGQSVAPGATIDWTISATVSAGDNAGLALWVADLAQNAANPATLDIPIASSVPATMAKFSRPLGVTNPPELDPTTGYTGVQRGTAGAKNLIQIGGGQNTFGEAMPAGTGIAENAVVDGGIGQGGSPQLVASGSFSAPVTEGAYEFHLENMFANVITTLNSPPDFSPVMQVAPSAAPGSLTFTVAANPYNPGDLNCDGLVNFGDIDPFVLAITDAGGYAAQFPSCDINNADINGDSLVNFGDIDPFVALLTGK